MGELDLDLDSIPAMIPPAGVVPNFVDPPTTAPQLYELLLFLLSIATVALAARLFTKVKIMKAVLIEDCKISARIASQSMTD